MGNSLTVFSKENSIDQFFEQVQSIQNNSRISPRGTAAMSMPFNTIRPLLNSQVVCVDLCYCHDECDDLCYSMEENGDVQGPEILDKDFLECQKPTMIEEIHDNEQFADAADNYFSELGYACIFMMYEKDIKPIMIRKTIDTIYSQLYVIRAQIGKYLSNYSGGSDTGPILFEDHFTAFAEKLRDKINLDKNVALKIIMRAFLKQTIEEIDYLELQIQQVDDNLCEKNKHKKPWARSDLPQNLFKLVIPDGLDVTGEWQTRERERCLISYLKRIVFKIIIGIERVEYYVNGKIRGRNSKLCIHDADIQDVNDLKENDPFGALALQSPIKAPAKVAHVSKGNISKNSYQNIVRTDPLGAFTLQFLIKEQIENLENQNIQSKCLLDHLGDHPTLKPTMLQRTFSRNDMAPLEKEKKEMIKRPDNYNKEKYKWQKPVPKVTKRKASQVQVDEVGKRNFQDLQSFAIEYALSEQEKGVQMEAQVELLKDLLFALSIQKIVDTTAQEQLFITICASRITKLQSNAILLRSVVNKALILLQSMENFQKSNLQKVIDRLTDLMKSNLKIGLDSSRHFENKNEGITWRALPTILYIITEINRTCKKSSFDLMRELKDSIENKVDNIQNNELFYFEQNLIPNMPLIFELFVEESEVNHQDFNMLELENFLDKVLIKQPEFARLLKELVDPRLNELYAMSDAEEALHPKLYKESVKGIVKNSYVLRMIAMAQILSGRAITRLHQSQQCSIATKFCKFLDEQLQDVRRYQIRSNLLQVVRDQSDRKQNQKLVNEKILFFLRSYFKWELSFNQLEQDPDCPQNKGLGYLVQNIDLFFDFVENKTSVLINKWVAQVVLFRLLNSIKHKELKQLFHVRFKNRIDSTLKKIAHDLHNGQYSFQSPFQYYHKCIRQKLYANFTLMMSQQLMDILKQPDNDVLANEYRNVFAQTWFIMMFTVYDIRAYELSQIEQQSNNTKYDHENSQSKKVQRIIMQFGKALQKAKRQDLLMPTREFIKHNLKDHHLPKLIKQVEKDVKLGQYDALDGLLLFLCVYTEVTGKLIKRGKDDIRQINILAQLVKICDLLKSGEKYKIYFRNDKEVVNASHDSFLMVQFKKKVNETLGFKVNEKKQIEQTQWMETYIQNVCKEFREIEKRICVCQLNKNDQISHTFYGVYCRYKLLEAKMDGGILYELTMKTSSATDELIPAYDRLRLETLRNIVNDDEPGEKHKDSVEQSFLVAERAFLHLEIYQYTLKEIQQRKNDNVLNVNNMQEQGNIVIEELEGMIHQKKIIVEQHQQSNFPMQAARIKQAELDSLLNRTQTKNQYQIDNEESQKKDIILDKIKNLYDNVLKRKENFIQVELDRQSNQKKRAARPEFPWYYYIQFYGKEFPAELTMQEHGFMVRGLSQAENGTDSSYFQIQAFLKALFPEIGERLKVQNRQALEDKIEGFENTNSQQEIPLIVIMEQIKPLTNKRKAKYGDLTKDFKRIRLEESEYEEEKRENFKKSDNLNFKRYFTKKVTSANKDFVKMANDKIKAELAKLCGEESPQLISKQVVKELYQIVRNWQGDFVGDGHAKTDEEFQAKVWREARVQEDAEAVETQKVIASVERMYNALKYADLRFYIFEVPKQFPNGFFMQPIKSLEPAVIVGACYADSVVNSWTNEIKTLSSSISSIEEKHEALYKAIMKILIANVQGGLASYIRIFFAKDGYHQLNNSNDQYLGVLRLFTSLDKLFPILQAGIDELHQGQTNADRDLSKLQVILDENMKRHYENLTNLEIDEKLMKEAKNIWREEYEDSD